MNTWEEMKAYVGFTVEDEALLTGFFPHVEPELPSIMEAFYARILAFPGTHNVLESEAQVERLKATLRQWARELFTGPHDDAYWQRRQRIGRVHVQIGLADRYMFTAMNLIRADFIRVAMRDLPLTEAVPTAEAIGRISDLDLAVMSGTYREAHEDLQLRTFQDLIIRNMPVTVLLLDDRGRVVAATRPSHRLFGVDVHAEVGKAYTSFLPTALVRAAGLDLHLRRAIETSHEVVLPRVVVEGGAHSRTFRISITPIEHELAQVLLHVEELTDIIHAETRAAQAEALARIGSLAANVAHEIRNPLTAISTTLQVIGGSLEDPDPRRAVIGKVQEQVIRLDRLVTDLLNYARPARSEALPLDLESAAVDARQQSGVQCGLSVQAPTSAVGDSHQIVQILVNLLQNARDAVGASGAPIRLIVGPGPEIVVEDEGPGITAELVARIFEPFVTTKTRGTGLGLAICRKLADAMGGTLQWEANVPHGARFRLKLLPAPLPTPRASPAGSEAHND